uniref:Cytochrome P450 family 4 subfamily B member 1 n=1 Tax=Equus caballus TaxID=9796 RepID=F6TKT2_HORSE
MSVSGLRPPRPLGSVSGLLEVTSLLGLDLLLLKAAQLYLRRQWLLKAFQEFPCPPSHWLYGHSREFQKGQELPELLKRVEKFPRASLCWLWGSKVLFTVYDPDYMKVILGRSGESKTHTPAGAALPSWYGLLLLNGQTWFQHRRMLTPAFHYNILKPYVGLMAESVRVMLVSPSLCHLHMLTHKPLFCHRMSDKPEEGSPAEGGRAGEGQEEETLGFPGHPPHCQKAPGLPRPCPPFRMGFGFRDHLDQMPDTTMCIKEALSFLHAYAPSCHRDRDPPLVYDQSALFSFCPTGVTVMLSFYALHYNPEVWPNPEVFGPSRFVLSPAQHSHAFLPFSGGSR